MSFPSPALFVVLTVLVIEPHYSLPELCPSSIFVQLEPSPQLLATKLVQQDKHPMEKPASQGTSGCKPLTTFVQTDTNAFQDVVQRLTGPSEIDKSQETAPKVAGTKRPTSKLHERRQHTRPKLEIVRPIINFKPCTSPTTPENPCLLASPVGTPSTIFSKLSIGEQETRGQSAAFKLNSEEEERAIKEKRFYLHPSPRSKRGHVEPELLTLFPLTSPHSSEKP